MPPRLKAHTAGSEELIHAQAELVKYYRGLLDKLQVKLSALFKEYAVNGVVTYADMARYNHFNRFAWELQVLVDEAITAREQIIRSRIKRGTAKEYHDILYQAEKVAHAGHLDRFGVLPFEARLEPASLIQVEEIIGKQMGKTPSLTETLATNAAKSQAAMREATTRALEGAGSDYKTMFETYRRELSKDVGRMVRIVHTDGQKMVNEAAQTSFQLNVKVELDRAGIPEDHPDAPVLVWQHDAPMTARESHVALHGCMADESGHWWSNGHSTTSPGGFGVPSEDIECKCYLTVMARSAVTKMSTAGGIVSLSRAA